MLAQRLREMADAEVIAIAPKQQGRGHLYRLTPAGEDFRPLIEGMSAWGQRWNQSILPEDLESHAADVRHPPTDRHGCRAGRSDGHSRFEFRGVPKAKAKERYWWLVIHRPEPEVCLENPGFEVDAVVTADLAAFTRLALGYLGLREALEAVAGRLHRRSGSNRPAVPAAQSGAGTGAEDIPICAGPDAGPGIAPSIDGEHVARGLNRPRQ